MTFRAMPHPFPLWCDGADAIPPWWRRPRFGLCEPGIFGARLAGLRPGLFHGPDVQAGYFEELRAPCGAGARLPRLWAGLELDALAHPDCRRAALCRSGLPHRLGALPQCPKATAARPWPWTGTPLLRRYVDEVYHGDGLAMARAYFAIGDKRPPARPAADHRPL